MRTEVFKPSWVRWLGLLVLGSVFTGLFVGTIVWPIVSPMSSNDWALFVFSFLLWGFMMTGSFICGWSYRWRVEIDEKGITKRFRTQIERVEWSELVKVEGTSTGGTSFDLICQDGRKMPVDTDYLRDREVLKQILVAKRNALPRNAEGEFHLQSRVLLACILSPVGLLLIAAGIFAPTAPADARYRAFILIVCVLLGLLLLLMSYDGYTKTWVVTRARISTVSLFGTRSFRLEGLTSIKLDSSRGSGDMPAMEWTTLRGADGMLRLGSSMENYTEVRDYVLSLVPRQTVTDNRGLKV